MAEAYFKVVKLQTTLEQAFRICRQVCIDSRMVIKDTLILERSFSMKASEKINWLSLCWPVRFEINAKLISEGGVLLKITASSILGSIVQNYANSQKLNLFAETVTTLAQCEE